MTHPDTQKMLQLVEEQTGYRVSVDLISGIQEHAQMISARPENPVHLIQEVASKGWIHGGIPSRQWVRDMNC